jgi:hypothetical protein
MAKTCRKHIVLSKGGKQIVTCAVCGKEYTGKVPRGGDGSSLMPRLHYSSPGDACPGSWRLCAEHINLEQNRVDF